MEGFWTLRSKRLMIQVLKPGTSQYRMTRFNWAGFVPRITLDYLNEFAEPEQRIASRITCAGAGLCSEYVHPDADEGVPIGMEFPRLGNGYMMKTEKPQSFPFNEPCRPFPFTCMVTDHSVTVKTNMPLCNGFAGIEEKTVSVEENRITIGTKLTNIGRKTLSIEEYNHNFLSLNGQPISPKYRLYIPCFDDLEKSKKLSDQIYGNDETHELRLSRMPDAPYMAFLNSFTSRKAEPTFTLSYDGSPLSVSEYDDFDPEKIVVWGIEHCMCCEVYFAADIRPGETKEWNRTWEFNC